MEINITTPSLLFPAISLLLLAFTNRFLALATLIRGLKKMYEDGSGDSRLIDQIDNLRKRVILIRNMQAFGIASLICCVLCMIALFEEWVIVAKYLFGLSLLLMVTSLLLSMRETLISVTALKIELATLEEKGVLKKND